MCADATYAIVGQKSQDVAGCHFPRLDRRPMSGLPQGVSCLRQVQQIWFLRTLSKIESQIARRCTCSESGGKYRLWVELPRQLDARTPGGGTRPGRLRRASAVEVVRRPGADLPAFFELPSACLLRRF